MSGGDVLGAIDGVGIGVGGRCGLTGGSVGSGHDNGLALHFGGSAFDGVSLTGNHVESGGRIHLDDLSLGLVVILAAGLEAHSTEQGGHDAKRKKKLFHLFV